ERVLRCAETLFRNQVWCVFLQHSCSASIDTWIACAVALDFAERTRGTEKLISCVGRALRLLFHDLATDAVALQRRAAYQEGWPNQKQNQPVSLSLLARRMPTCFMRRNFGRAIHSYFSTEI